MQDVVLMEVMHTLTDLLGEQDHIQFGQLVLLLCDPVKEFTPIHTARAKREASAGLSKALRGLVHSYHQESEEADPGKPKGAAAIWGFMEIFVLACSQLRVRVVKRN